MVKQSGSQPVPVKGTQTTKTSLCVSIQRTQSSVELGHAAQWTISAWTTGGNVPDAIVRLVATPSSLSGLFNFGCGSQDGTGSCDLGEVASQSAPRQLEAQLPVPGTFTTVKSVELSVIASAAHLPTDPRATATVAVTKPPAPAPGSGNGGGTTTTTSPLPVGDLPFVNGANGTTGTLSPGGNAGGLFPTVNPASSNPAAAPNTQGQQKASARAVANTSALPLGAPVVGAQLIGLGVLALAFVLAVTRLSIRRRPATAKPAPSAPAKAAGKNGPEKS